MSCLLGGAMLAISFAQASAHQNAASGSVLQEGIASYYGRGQQGRRTASGSRFNPNALTAAHPWLPFGTRLRVTTRTGRSVEVVVNDRLPSTRRIIDLSYGAARLLGIIQQGVAYVALSPG